MAKSETRTVMGMTHALQKANKSSGNHAMHCCCVISVVFDAHIINFVIVMITTINRINEKLQKYITYEKR